MMSCVSIGILLVKPCLLGRVSASSGLKKRKALDGSLRMGEGGLRLPGKAFRRPSDEALPEKGYLKGWTLSRHIFSVNVSSSLHDPKEVSLRSDRASIPESTGWVIRLNHPSNASPVQYTGISMKLYEEVRRRHFKMSEAGASRIMKKRGLKMRKFFIGVMGLFVIVLFLAVVGFQFKWTLII